MPATARWLGLALLGILIAAAVSIAASHLASQQIGLASEPISAGDALVPHTRSRPHRHPGHSRGTAPAKAPTAPAPPVTTAPQPTTPTVPPPTAPALPTTPAGPSRPGGSEGDHSGGGGGGRHADD
jgi:hypothetical protein